MAETLSSTTWECSVATRFPWGMGLVEQGKGLSVSLLLVSVPLVRLVPPRRAGTAAMVCSLGRFGRTFEKVSGTFENLRDLTMEVSRNFDGNVGGTFENLRWNLREPSMETSRTIEAPITGESQRGCR